jgi:hypothetical protein
MKVLTLSKRFLSYHPRAGEPTHFRDKYLAGAKIHTIRANAKGYYKNGDLVSVREWSGKPYASKQDVIWDGVRIGVVPVQIGGIDFAFVGRPNAIVSVPLGQLARNDGLCLHDLLDWLKVDDKHTFHGSLIYLTGFRYREQEGDQCRS